MKCSDKLVIDEWYARGNYHHNYGDGMDCYKVGVTLGSGASLPFAGGKFWMMGHNYATARTLDNGPIRTSVELTYAPFDVDGTPVTLTKVISLDSQPALQPHGQCLRGRVRRGPIAAGFVRHDVKQMPARRRLDGYVRGRFGLEEPRARRRHLPGRDSARSRDARGHAGPRRSRQGVKPGQTLTYYAGSGWSQGGVEDMKEWVEEIAQAQAAAVSPLR